MGKRLAWTWLCGVMVVAVGTSGCVIEDFKDGGDEYANGCERALVPDSDKTIPIDVSNPSSELASRCLTTKQRPVVFEVTAAGDCRLCGGMTDGESVLPDDNSSRNVTNPFQTGGQPLPAGSSITVTFNEVGVFGFYCDGKPWIAGAVFVEAENP